MHEHIREWIKAVFICACLSVIGFEAWTNGEINKRTESQLQPVIENVNTAAKNLADASGDESDALKDQIQDFKQLTASGQKMLDQAAATLSAIQGTAGELTGEVAALHKTTDAATDLAVQGRADLATLDSSIKGTGPLIQAYTRTGEDLSRRINDPHIDALISSLAAVTASGAATAEDLRKVADKETAYYLKPVPMWQKPIRRAGEFIDIGAAIARHLP